MTESISEHYRNSRKYCSGCCYSRRAGQYVICEYLLIEGERRGCPAGPGCTRKAKKPSAKAQQIMLLNQARGFVEAV